MPKDTNCEPRYRCPVCTELPLQKLKITQKDGGVFLILDYCKGCGGVWFDQDEVKLSQGITSPKVRQQITQQPKQGLIHCRDCNSLMDRNLDQCSDCGWQNRIDCPVCKLQLQRQQHQQLILDSCQRCRGVWFDQIELLALWNGPLRIVSNSPKTPAALTQQHHQPHQENSVMQTVGETIVEVSLDGLTHGIDILDVKSLTKIADSAIETVGELPEVATVILEVTGEVASDMTAALAEVLGALLSS